MTGGKKLLLLIGFIGLIMLISLAVFSACDNRKAVNPKLDVNQSIQLNLSPQRLVIHSMDKPDTVKMNIRVRDADGNGIDSVEVTINRVPQIGTIVSPEMTDSGGHITAYFITDPGGLEDSLVTFIASSGDAADTAELSVTVSLATVTMTLLPPNLIIHSLNKPDTVEIDIRVRDENGTGIDSVEVELARSPEIGTIVPPQVTQSGGYASALYITDPGIGQDMQVTLTASTGFAIDTDILNIIVSLQGEIESMNISLGTHTLVANGEDNTKIFVSVLDTTGGPIVDGTAIFMENGGAGYSGSLDSTYVHTANGIAVFTLTAPPFIDTSSIIDVDNLTAWGESVSGNVVYAYSSITYIPDVPNMLEIVTIPSQMVAGSGVYQVIDVRVTDAHGSFVRDGTQVRFSNQLITSDITALTTTMNGYAAGIYTVGTEAGLDIIKAFITFPGSTDTLWSNAVPLAIASSVPTNITITTDDSDIPVGGNPTMIYATMQDENGNALSDGYGIIFRITASPGYPNIAPQAPSFNYVATDDSVCYETSEFTNVNGVASVTIFSGTQAGTVRIKVISIDNYSIFKEKPLITVQSGPPAVISILPSNVAGVDGQAIATGISAAIWDQYTNPVEPLTAVHFEVLPDTIAYIDGAALTGGWIDTTTGQVVGTIGLATTIMRYSCLNTFDTVRVIAQSGDMEDTSEAVVLAIFVGAISVDVQPGVIYLNPTGHDTVDYADVEAQLLDGLGCPIHNGVINFTVENCGTISGPYSDTTDRQGYANTTFKITYRQLLPDADTGVPHCTAKIKARLRGYPDIVGAADCFCNANN
jgi:hypothetical protein